MLCYIVLWCALYHITVRQGPARCMYVCMYVCVYIYIYIYIHIYTHTYIHTHTCEVRHDRLHGVHRRDHLPAGLHAEAPAAVKLSYSNNTMSNTNSNTNIINYYNVILYYIVFCGSPSRWEPKLPPPPPLKSPLYDIFWGLHKADLYVPPKKICHTRAIIVGVGGEILVVTFGQFSRGREQTRVQR